MKAAFEDCRWLNEPARWSIRNDVLSVTAADKTDFWRETHYGFVHDNGHALATTVDSGIYRTTALAAPSGRGLKSSSVISILSPLPQGIRTTPPELSMPSSRRHGLYEINYGGSTEEIRRCRFKGDAEECMAEYDLGGWRAPDLSDPGELSYHMMKDRN